MVTINPVVQDRHHHRFAKYLEVRHLPCPCELRANLICPNTVTVVWVKSIGTRSQALSSRTPEKSRQCGEKYQKNCYESHSLFLLLVGNPLLSILVRSPRGDR